MIKTTLKDYYFPILLGLAAGLSLMAWFISWKNGWVLAYNDAMSHLNISRLVIDNQKPGLAQLGSVWPPFSHILTLPLIWIDPAWRSGFAGSIFSMAAYVATVAAIHGIVIELTRSRLAAVVAAIAAAININFLYLQSTPLTEVLFVAFFTGSVYFLIRYLKTSHAQYLIPLALLTALQMTTRYDGWFFALVAGIVMIIYEIYVKRQSIAKALGKTALFAVPVAFTALLWFGYNALIFGDPMFFATGPYSASSQQDSIESHTDLITKHDVLMSSEALGHTIGHTVGWYVLVIALIGWLLYVNPRNKINSQPFKFAIFGLLTSILVFNFIALFMGISIINVPELNWNPFGPDVARYFNVRYGLMALPFAAVGVGMLSAKWRRGIPLLVIILITQSAITMVTKPISLLDGLYGASAYTHSDIASQLRANVKEEDEVLVSFFSFPAATHQSHLHLKQYIHEGVGAKWKESLANPQKHADWVLIPSHNTGDPIYTAVKHKNKEKFQKHYKLEYRSDNGQLYRRLKTNQHPQANRNTD